MTTEFSFSEERPTRGASCRQWGVEQVPCFEALRLQLHALAPCLPVQRCFGLFLGAPRKELLSAVLLLAMPAKRVPRAGAVLPAPDAGLGAPISPTWGGPLRRQQQPRSLNSSSVEGPNTSLALLEPRDPEPPFGPAASKKIVKQFGAVDDSAPPKLCAHPHSSLSQGPVVSH